MSSLIKNFLKNPEIISAFEWDGRTETLSDPEIKMFMANNPHFKGEGGLVFIQTLDGMMEARPGDYIIKGPRGDIYPCRREVFLETYSEAIEVESRPTRNISDVIEIPTAMVLPEAEQRDFIDSLPPERPEKKTEPKPKRLDGGRFQKDLEQLEARFGGPLEELRGETIEIELQDLNTICPREFVKAKSYMGLVGFLKRTYGVDLKITSQRSK